MNESLDFFGEDAGSANCSIIMSLKEISVEECHFVTHVEVGEAALQLQFHVDIQSIRVWIKSVRNLKNVNNGSALLVASDQNIELRIRKDYDDFFVSMQYTSIMPYTVPNDRLEDKLRTVGSMFVIGEIYTKSALALCEDFFSLSNLEYI